MAPALALVACGSMAVVGCDEKKPAGGGTIAATVNREEISVPQVNLVLQQQRQLRPEQTDAASRQVLERLIDQTLAAQKAVDLHLDRDPRVGLQLEAARREVLARAFAESASERASRPTAEEMHRYYEDKPALFRERRIYNLQEVTIEARPDQHTTLREQLAAVKHIGEFLEYLKSQDFRFAVHQAVRAAEQLPLASLETLSRMSDGQAVLVPAPGGVQVVVLAGSRRQPLSEEQARPVIEQALFNERRRKVVQAELQALRAAARIEYQGVFATGPRAGPDGTAAEALLTPAASAPSAGEADSRDPSRK